MMCLGLKECAKIILWYLHYGWTHGQAAGAFKSSSSEIYPMTLGTDGRLIIFK
jgi:hypothetical protein